MSLQKREHGKSRELSTTIIYKSIRNGDKAKGVSSDFRKDSEVADWKISVPARLACVVLFPMAETAVQAASSDVVVPSDD